MNEKDTPPGDAFTSSETEESLRQKAEAILSSRRGDEPDFIKGKSPFFLKRTMRNLQVHQIELEMQNDELRKAQAEVEAARVRYFDLYDLAPVGYITLNDQGMILESNYEAAGLLGVSRRGLANQPIVRFISEEDQDRYDQQCRKVLETRLPHVIELRMKGRDRKEFWARLEATIAKAASGGAEFRIVLTNITERKRAEEALRDSLEFSSSLIRYMQDGLSVLDLDGVTLDVNPALCAMTGFSEEELVGGKPPYLYWPPEEYERIQKALEETLTGNSKSDFELTFMRNDGVRFPVVVSPFAVKNRDGVTISYSATVKDITAWKQAEQALKEGEAFQKDILNSLPAHIAVLDEEGLILSVNEPWLQFARANGNPLVEKVGVGASYVDVCQEALRQRDPYAKMAVDGLHSVLSGKQSHFSMEYPCEGPDGVRWFTMEILVPTSSGRGAIVAHTDITERRRAEEALRDANQKLRLHFEQTPMAVIEWDLAFRVTNWNPAAQTIFGYTREEALGRHATFIVPEIYRRQVDGIWQALTEKSGGERSTNANLHKSGAQILCEWYNTPLIDEHGIVAGVASVVMDITERSEALQMLAWEKSALELIGSVTPLHEVLDRLMLSLEKELPGALCSVLLLDDDGLHLRHGAAPSLPEEYNLAVDGFPIGAVSGSCGTAAYTRRQVIVEDIATDPLWTDFPMGASTYGLRACWSTPIQDHDDEILGTFAIYYREPRRPAPTELEFIERAVHVVRIAIKRKAAEEAILESERKFRTLFENAGDAILIIDGDRFIDCNARTLELFQCQSRDQIVGRVFNDFSSLIQPDGLPSINSVKEKVTAALAGQPQYFEWMHRTLSGSTFPADVSLNQVELGGKILLQAIVRDISERKAAEAEIHSLNAGLELRVEERTNELQSANASLSDFKAALDQHALVSITDSKGVITYANDKFCAISMFPLDELIGRDHRIVNSGHHPPAYFQDLWKTVMKGNVWKGEMKNRAKDGTVFWMDTTIVPFLGHGGKPDQFVAIRTDITERKKAEQKIGKLNTDLENRAAELTAANKELEAFSYSVSHDLRAPLRAVDGFSRIVLEDYADKLDGEGRRKLEVIRSESQRMGRLIDDLLAFSRLGRQPIEPLEIDMGGMARSVFDELAAGDPVRKLRLDLRPLPSASGSEALVRQVWVNLIGNALKFTRQRDSGEIEIGSRTGDHGETIYYVKDNGVGFDMRHSGKLFGVFQRLHSQEEFPGTGVGLALVERIVHRHGGRIWAESEVDRGATFFFTLSNQNP